MGRPPIFGKRMTTAERVRRHRERKRASAPPKDTVASLRARCAGLEAELRRRGARSSTTTAAAGAARLEVEVAELRDENHKFRVELEAQNQVIKTRDGGGLTAAQFRKFEMVFHPDNSAGKETREWASRSSDNSATSSAPRPNCRRWTRRSSRPGRGSSGRVASGRSGR